MMRITVPDIFEKVIRVVLNVMLLFITLGIMIGVVRLFLTVGNLIEDRDITSEYFRIISDVLTLFILIELSRSLVDYFTTHRLRLTFIVDAAIVFVLREIMIKLFEHKIGPGEIYALSALLLVLGTLRIASIVVYQRERKMLDSAAKPSSG